MKRRGRPPHDDLLTPAEWRVTELLRHGLTVAGAARQLSISKDAARQHARSATAKAEMGGVRGLRHFEGIAAGSARRRTTMEADMQHLGPLGQISRQVEDLDRARAFLRDVLGLRELYAFPPLAFFDLGGTRLMLRETGRRDGADILYFQVTDIGAAHHDLTARGVTFSGAPHMIHRHADGCEEWMAFFRDDEGRDMALMAQSRP